MKLIILDRDGVINQDSDAFIKSAEEWVPLPGSIEAIARLSQAGWTIAVATNQSGLARGLFDMTALSDMHFKMQRLVMEQGGRIDLIVHCPHGPKDECSCRKPRPGMYRTIAEHFKLDDLSGVPVVGDSHRDLHAGLMVGCTPYLVKTGKGLRTLENVLPVGTQVFDDLSAVTDHLLADPA
jgi:D-glycero-D-manno-heptose 1,7-bisphosphate phosphatase